MALEHTSDSQDMLSGVHFLYTDQIFHVRNQLTGTKMLEVDTVETYY